jgi:hypothetical protein
MANQHTPFRIRRDVLEVLDPLRKVAAMSAIKRGAWVVVEGDGSIVAPTRAGECGDQHGIPAHT